MDPKELDLWNAAKAEADAGFKQEQDAAVQSSIATDDAQVAAQFADPLNPTVEEAQAAGGVAMGQTLRDTSKAALSGALKAVFESKDFLQETVGLGMDPGDVNPSSARQWADSTNTFLTKKSWTNGVVRGIAEFGVGFIGLGKIKLAGAALKGGPGAVGWAVDAARAAATSAIAFDPHEERLSNLIQNTGAGQWPLLGPVTEYLAAKPEDGKAEGRFKAALESLTLDGIAAAGFLAAVKGIKATRAGDKAAAEAAHAEAEQAFTNLQRRGDLEEHPRSSSALPHADEADVDNWARADGWVPEGEHSPLDTMHAGPTLPDAGTSPIEQTLRHPPGDAPGTTTSAPRVTPEPQLSAVSTRETPRATAKATEAVITPEQVQTHLKVAAKDVDAIAEHGSMEAASSAGHTFAGTEDAGLIPWQKITTPEATRAWVGQVLEEQRPLVATAPITDARVDAMVAQRARLFNEDPDILKGIIKQAGEDARGTTATMETGYLLANSAFKETYELGQRISVGNFTGFEGRDAALAALRGRLQTAVEMAAAAKAMSSAAGRSLRRMRGEFSAERMAGLQAINVEGLDPEALAKVIASTGGDPALLAKVGQPTVLRQITDWVGGVYAANLMWGWSTQTINAVTSAAQLYLRPLEVILGSGPLQAIGKLRGDETMKAAAVSVRTQARREMLTDVSVLTDGLAAAKWAFLNGDSKIAPHTIESLDVSARSGAAPIIWREVKGMDDVIANALMASNAALHGSLRLAGTVDEMIKVIRYRAIISAKASVEADAMPTLKAGSREYADFIKARVERSFDDAGRAIDVDALAEAKASTFQQDLIKTGTDDTWTGGASFGAAYQGFAANYPLLRLITPFVKTPSNLIRYGVKLTPGLNLLQKEYLNAARGLKGDEEQARAIGQMMMGIMLASTAVSLRMDGRITGAGPQNEAQNKQWRSDGNMPYALSGTGENGKRPHGAGGARPSHVPRAGHVASVQEQDVSKEPRRLHHRHWR
jgi:hypothetical protein